MINTLRVLLRSKPARKCGSVASSLYCTSRGSDSEVLHREEYYLKSKIKKQEAPEDEAKPGGPPVESEPAPAAKMNFPYLLRNSAFVDLGDPVGKIVTGEVFLIVNNDLYIDFGWKFHTVCTVPQEEVERYKIGSQVRLKIKDLELCSRFLGDDYYISLLEADCTLVGLHNKDKHLAEKSEGKHRSQREQSRRKKDVQDREVSA